MVLFQNKTRLLCDKFREGMKIMQDHDIGRIILTLYEQPRKINPREKELTSADFLYYPFEELFAEEKEAIMRGLDYNVIALVSQKNEPIKYPADCIETIERTRLNPPHDSQHPECPENYYSDKKCVLLNDQAHMEFFANHLLKHDWTPEILDAVFQKEVKRKQGIKPQSRLII